MLCKVLQLQSQISVIRVTDFLLSQGTSMLQKDTGGYWHIPGAKAKHATRNQIAVLFSPHACARCILSFIFF